MVELIPYTPAHREEMLPRVQDFFRYHRNLLTGDDEPNEEISVQTVEALDSWQSEWDTLYVILFYQKSVGFLHLRGRGPNVAWIEDIYVDKMYRGQGIATQSIMLAENMVRKESRYDAICIDVAPRNAAALRLYHRLGYNELSIITVRKELEKDGELRDRSTELLGFAYHY